MRTARQIPWFLIASILISLSALALANFIAPPLKEPGSYLALALVILIPGYLAVLIMFPAGGDLDLGRRLLLSLGASLLLAGLISLILYLTPGAQTRVLRHYPLIAHPTSRCHLLSPLVGPTLQ